MKNTYLFFDYNGKIVNKLKNIFEDDKYYETNINFWTGDCRNIIRYEMPDMIVSPANSSGFMDGGIDYYLKIMFPEIEKTVQDKIKTYKISKANNNILYNRCMLPIGSSFIVPTGNNICSELICTPTMEDPDSIRGTENVFYSFYGILQCVEKNRKNKVIAVPGLGTGTGGISSGECAREIKRAWDAYLNGKILNENIILSTNKDEYILSEHACKQLDY